MNEVFKSKLEEIMPAEELLFPPTPGFGPYKSYLEHAVPHPAKMNTLLLEWLVRAFSEPGDTLLDPMAGSGSLGVVAYLHGRNAIQVELEKRFYDWMEKAREKVEAEGRKHGWIKNICGDARRLSELLSQADICITSPPYASTEFYYGEKPQEFWQTLANTTGRKAWANPQSKTRRTISAKEEPLSESNIANLPHGPIDIVLTSPPYSESSIQDFGTSNKALLEFEEKVRTAFRTKGFFEYKGKKYTEKEWREINNGELKPRGIPELWAEILKQREQNRYNDENPNNIANLPHGKIDTIITSPPYADAKKGGEVDKEAMAKRWDEKFKEKGEKWNSWGKTWKTEGRLRGLDALGSGYSDSKTNIGNLPFGGISAIITSPPYLKSAEEGAGINKQREGDVKIGCSTLGRTVTHPEAIDNAKEYGSIDAVITSPPYEGSLEGTTRHTRGGIASRDPALAQTGTYDEISPTVLRLRRHGRSNPKQGGPYGRSLAHPYTEFPTVMSFGVPVGYSPNMDNIGNLKSTDEEYEALARGLMQDGKPTYLSEMFKVYGEMFRVLKPGGLAVIVVKPFIRDKKVVDLPYHTWLLMAKVGFQLKKLYKLRLDRQSFWRILFYKKHPHVPLIAHEYVLVCQKPGGEDKPVEPAIDPVEFMLECSMRGLLS